MALLQLRDPMNIMLVAVALVSILIGQVSTGIVVALLIVLNVALGTRQELMARASVDALSKMQVPQARVVRDGDVRMVPASENRSWRHRVCRGRGYHARRRPHRTGCDTRGAGGGLNWRERHDRQGCCAAGLTVSRSATGRTFLFQNTSVTGGTGSMVVTETGMQTQMGQIATDADHFTRTRSPLQKELDSLTKVLGTIAWGRWL